MSNILVHEFRIHGPLPDPPHQVRARVKYLLEAASKQTGEVLDTEDSCPLVEDDTRL